MKFDFNQPILRANGESFKSAPETEGGEVTLAYASTFIGSALLAAFKDEVDTLPGEDKHKRYKLSQRIFSSHNQWVDACAGLEDDEPNPVMYTDVTIEELTLIKLVISKGYQTELAGALIEVIENPKG